MERILRPTFSGLIASLAILMSLTSTRADSTQAYCSTENTGTDDADWTYQSNGWCSTHCNDIGTFAFAVIQYKSCSCSNYIPADQTDISKCQVDCPGFPDDKCGSKDDGLYIYIKLAGSPSGTAGGSQATSAAATSAAATSVAATSAEASSADATSAAATSAVVTSAAVSSSKPVPSSTKITTSSAAITSRQPSTTFQTSAVASVTQDKTTVQVVTESGAIVTRTVVLTPSNASASDSAKPTSSKSNTGAIVGGVVGGIGGIALIVGLILFLLWRKRKQQAEQGHERTSITRNTSTMSKAGLLGGKAEKDTQYPPKIATRYGSQNSRYDPESNSPISASGRRYSQPLVFDSRLNPTQLMVFDNGSRGSIDDSADYGRRLGVANPDPPNRESMDRR